MKRIELESKTQIHFAEPGESVTYPLNSIKGVASAGSGQRGWVRRKLESKTVVIYLSPADALSAGVAIPAEAFNYLFAEREKTLTELINYWHDEATKLRKPVKTKSTAKKGKK